MCSQNHTKAVDYFALGVIGYEFMNGVRPYNGKTRKEIKEKIMARQASVKKMKFHKVGLLNQHILSINYFRESQIND